MQGGWEEPQEGVQGSLRNGPSLGAASSAFPPCLCGVRREAQCGSCPVGSVGWSRTQGEGTRGLFGAAGGVTALREKPTGAPRFLTHLCIPGKSASEPGPCWEFPLQAQLWTCCSSQERPWLCCSAQHHLHLLNVLCLRGKKWFGWKSAQAFDPNQLSGTQRAREIPGVAAEMSRGQPRDGQGIRTMSHGAEPAPGLEQPRTF